MLRDYIPGVGARTLTRWRKLQQDALSLDVLAALAWGKWIEANVAFLGGQGHVRMWLAWLGVALLLSAWHVYEKRLDAAADAAADAAGDMHDALDDLDLDTDDETRY